MNKEVSKIKQSYRPAWVVQENSIDNEAVDWANEVGKYLANEGLSTSSLRRFFGELRRIQTDFERFKSDIPMLRAKLAYDAKRKGQAVEDFYEITNGIIINIDKDHARFNRFVKIVEAIVAFHKFAGGKE